MFEDLGALGFQFTVPADETDLSRFVGKPRLDADMHTNLATLHFK